jgi:hypothetical protein
LHHHDNDDHINTTALRCTIHFHLRWQFASALG